jgi:hypothetical protein
MWEVKRHGGRACDDWLSVYLGDNEEEARKIYEKTSRQMRQGGLELRLENAIVLSKTLKRQSVFRN